MEVSKYLFFIWVLKFSEFVENLHQVFLDLRRLIVLSGLRVLGAIERSLGAVMGLFGWVGWGWRHGGGFEVGAGLRIIVENEWLASDLMVPWSQRASNFSFARVTWSDCTGIWEFGVAANWKSLGQLRIDEDVLRKLLEPEGFLHLIKIFSVDSQGLR